MVWERGAPVLLVLLGELKKDYIFDHVIAG